MIVLALDPATKTGWACSNGASGAVSHERLEDRKTKTRPGLNPLQRRGAIGRRFAAWLDAELDRHGIEYVVVERQMMGRGGGALTLGLEMLVLVMCSQRHLAVEDVAPSMWRAWARKTGVWTPEGKSDEADARAILDWWMTIRAPLVVTETIR